MILISMESHVIALSPTPAHTGLQEKNVWLAGAFIGIHVDTRYDVELEQRESSRRSATKHRRLQTESRLAAFAGRTYTPTRGPTAHWHYMPWNNGFTHAIERERFLPADLISYRVYLSYKRSTITRLEESNIAVECNESFLLPASTHPAN